MLLRTRFNDAPLCAAFHHRLIFSDYQSLSATTTYNALPFTRSSSQDQLSTPHPVPVSAKNHELLAIPWPRPNLTVFVVAFGLSGGKQPSFFPVPCPTSSWHSAVSAVAPSSQVTVSEPHLAHSILSLANCRNLLSVTSKSLPHLSYPGFSFISKGRV